MFLRFQWQSLFSASIQHVVYRNLRVMSRTLIEKKISFFLCGYLYKLNKYSRGKIDSFSSGVIYIGPIVAQAFFLSVLADTGSVLCTMHFAS